MNTGHVILISLFMTFSGPLSFAGQMTYTNDALNRVTQVTYATGSAISYTYDSAGNRSSYSGTINISSDTVAPSIAMVSPTSGTPYTTANGSITLSGTAADNTSVAKVIWQNDSGQFGLASGTSTWTIPALPLHPGANNFKITARDQAGNTAEATLTVTYSTASEYTISVSASPGSGGNISGNGTFASGASRTVTALANNGYTFVSWTEGGTIVSTSAIYSFTLNGDRNLVANFAPEQTCGPVPSGLLAWWTGELDGGDWEAANNGVLHSVQIASGEVGNGFSLSGTDSFIQVPDNIPLHTPYALTLEMWIKPTEVNAYHYLFTKSGFNYKDWNLYLWKGGLHAEFLDASSTRNEDGVGLDTPDGVIPAGVFSHIALTFDTQTHVAEIFVNGVSVARNAFPTISNLRVTPGDIFIGSSSGGATGFQGVMDEVSLYRRALTSDEIRGVYQAGAGGKCRPLLNGIAFAGGASGYHNTGGTSRTLQITVDGTNTLLAVGWGHDGNGHVTSVTYDGVPMVSLGTQPFDTVNPQNFNVGMFYLLNPHAGTHDLVLTRDIATSTMDYTIALYAGVDQARPPEIVGQGATTSLTDQPSATVSTTCSQCWVVGAVYVDKSIVFDSANLRLREQSPDQTTIFDSDGPVSAGSHTFSWRLTQPGHSGWMFATLAPAAQTVATPTITPEGGTFAALVQVTMACATPGATIRYTTDGTDPTATSPTYTNPVTLTASATVKAKAFASGYNDSTVASAVFTITPPVWTITATAGANGTVTPSGGTTKNAGESLTLSATPSQSYDVDQWLLDGAVAQTGGVSFTLSNIRANHTVQVTFRTAVVDVANGLFAYYHFDGNLVDSGGNGFDGINYGAVADADRNGTPNSAIHFAGTGNWAKLPIGASKFSGDFSVALWLKLDDFAAQYPAIINGDTGFIRLEAAGPLYAGEGNYQKIKFYQLGQSQVWSGSTFETGRWYHLGVVRSGTNYRIYVDGALSGQNDMPAVNVTGSYLQLGNDALNTYGGAYFHGSLDDLRFYSRALNASEVQVLYSNPNPTATPTINPSSGTFAGQALVTLTCATPGAIIRYTTDGTDPTASSPAYTTPLTLTASATLKAKAFATGYGESAVVTATFTITAPLNIITVTAGANGTATPSGDAMKAAGDSITVTATPSQGYDVDRWTLDGSLTQAGGTSFTLSNIQANHTIQVSFKARSSDGLLAYYPFNGDFNDATGNGFDGINYGATWDADRNGASGSAIKFSGTGTWVKLPIGASYFSQDFSIVLWLKLDDFAAQYPAIINGDTGFIRLEAAGPLYVGEGNYRKIKFYQLGQSQVWTGTTFDTGLWYQLAVVRAGTDYRIYVNGALSGENDMPAVSVNGGYLQVGNDALNTYGGAYFHGSLDDLRFYGQALSPTQVQELFAGPRLIPHLNSLTINNGGLRCVLRGPAGASVLIESSTDLVNWNLEHTHVVPESGSMDITLLDQITTATGGKFYRARVSSSSTAPFADDFNRPDSATVGNGWLNSPSDGAYHLVVKDGRLSVDPNDPTETGAIVYHPMAPLPATVSVKFTDKNGFGSLRNRYQSSIAVLYNPATGKGYGLQFTRADQNYNDSQVTVWDGDTTVTTIPCSFQFGTEISVTASFQPDGSIQGTIRNAETSFPFSVGARSIESAGANVMIGLNRSGSGTILPTADDLSVTSP